MEENYFQKQRADRQVRIQSINLMITQERSDIERKLKKMSVSILSQRKYKAQKLELQKRINFFSTYSKHIIQQFFNMILDQNIIALTTEVDIIQKIDKFKKNIFGTLQKIHINLDNQDEEGIVQIQKNVIPKKQNRSLQSRTEQRERSRGKNSKIGGESAADMNIWLLKNFQNPYPSLQQKMQMAKKGNLSLVQVNNWFINARQRTIKKYHCKQPQLL